MKLAEWPQADRLAADSHCPKYNPRRSVISQAWADQHASGDLKSASAARGFGEDVDRCWCRRADVRRLTDRQAFADPRCSKGRVLIRSVDSPNGRNSRRRQICDVNSQAGGIAA